MVIYEIVLPTPPFSLPMVKVCVPMVSEDGDDGSDEKKLSRLRGRRGRRER
jgi:hypothetical protein